MTTNIHVHNMTPHPINMILINGLENGISIKYDSEGVIRAKQQDTLGEFIETDLELNNSSCGVSIPVIHSKYGEPEGIPDDINKNDIYIVSLLAYKSLKENGYDMTPFYCVAGTVRDSEGRIIGCSGISKPE